MDVAQLNKQYEIAGHLKFVESHAKIPFISVSNSSAEALISLYGGQVLCYRPLGQQQDLLFLSDKAVFDGEKAIRGGIPVCWPWFGVDPEGLNRPNHGFARNSFWSVSKTQMNSDHETKVELRLLPTDEFREYWPYSFDLTLEITVGNTLTLELVTYNTGDKAFSITQALHTYFNVGDIRQTKVLGLDDNHYFDKLDHGNRRKQLGAVTFSEEVDRIYEEVDKQLSIEDPVINRKIEISSRCSKTAVVWNPWMMTSAKISDLGSHDYLRFLCVEASNAGTDKINILPGNKHRLMTNFKILSDG